MPGATPTLRQRSRVKLGGETFHIEALRGEGGFAKVRPIFELFRGSVISLKVGLIFTSALLGVQCLVARWGRGAMRVEGLSYSIVAASNFI